MFKTNTLFCLLCTLILLGACNVIQPGNPKRPPNLKEVPYNDLTFRELGPEVLADPGIPGCSLADLRPFGWKTVDSGFVDIRTQKDYAIQVESLYQEGYQDYLQTRIEYPDTYETIPEMSYEEFLLTCDVFPDVDFRQYSVLGAQAIGTGCIVTFEKHVLRDEQARKFHYEIVVIEEGECEMVSQTRNLILVPRISPEYSVEYSLSVENH